MSIKQSNIGKNNPVFNLLTKRQFEVVVLVCDDHSTEAISNLLFVTESAIKQHITNVYKIIGVGAKSGQKRQLLKNMYAEALDPFAQYDTRGK